MTGNRVFLLLIGVGIVAVGLLGWILGISPVITQASNASAETQTVLADNSVHQAKLDELLAQYENLDELRKQFVDLQVAIPDTPATDDLLDQLNAIAGSSSVAISAFTAGNGTPWVPLDAVVAVEPAVEPEGDEATAAPEDGTVQPPVEPVPVEGVALADKFFTVELSVTIQGTPDAIVSFVDQLQRGERTYLVTNVNLTGGSTAGATAVIQGFVFVLRDGTIMALPDFDAEGNVVESAEPTETPTPTPAPTEEPAE